MCVRRSEGRCTETGFLEFHHVVPYAAGGPAVVENIELRCAAHNAYEAAEYFGPLQPSLMRETSPTYAAEDWHRCCARLRHGYGAASQPNSVWTELSPESWMDSNQLSRHQRLSRYRVENTKHLDAIVDEANHERIEALSKLDFVQLWMRRWDARRRIPANNGDPVRLNRWKVTPPSLFR